MNEEIKNVEVVEETKTPVVEKDEQEIIEIDL